MAQHRHLRVVVLRASVLEAGGPCLAGAPASTRRSRPHVRCSSRRRQTMEPAQRSAVHTTCSTKCVPDGRDIARISPLLTFSASSAFNSIRPDVWIMPAKFGRWNRLPPKQPQSGSKIHYALGKKYLAGQNKAPTECKFAVVNGIQTCPSFAKHLQTTRPFYIEKKNLPVSFTTHQPWNFIVGIFSLPSFSVSAFTTVKITNWWQNYQWRQHFNSCEMC